MVRLLWVGVGGAFGSVFRYLISGWVTTAIGARFPLGTLVVNTIGSFVLGALMELGLSTTLLTPTARIALTTGAMGGFTTFSTFSYETVQYLRDGTYLLAGINIGTNILACLLACFLGVALTKWAIGG